MIKENLGKTLLAGNLIVFSLIIYSTFINQIRIDADILTITQFALALTSFAVFYFVMQTWRTFKEKDLFIGFSGFLIIFIAYTLIAALSLLKVTGMDIEASLNVLVTIGYILITIGAGWLK